MSLAYGLGCLDSDDTESTANGDIETFDSAVVCDDVDDCEDGSDEIPC